MKTTSDELLRNNFWETINNFVSSKSINFKDFEILIFGQGGKTRSFYQKISKDPNVEILWTGSGAPSKNFFLKMIPFECGLVRLKIYRHLSLILESVGSNSQCGFYYIHKSLTVQILNRIKTDLHGIELHKIVTSEHPYFLMEINFDTDGDGETINRSVNYSDNLPEEICDILKLNS
ncbi:MAG: hypothetical protein AB7S78_02890 [Candidatus Omnitrophota bacterium]